MISISNGNVFPYASGGAHKLNLVARSSRVLYRSFLSSKSLPPHTRIFMSFTLGSGNVSSTSLIFYYVLVVSLLYNARNWVLFHKQSYLILSGKHFAMYQIHG